ncbi:hypothetical protein [Aquimarina sp. 2201CG5-10]|uniref:hypothetical protein n=1 Tax=Aquimarina callyspongiae TaxID=3098150 RepID=UPI002AB5D46F|nr:hypothetical protein [Aquimarina sp. 2201CG5-10]MDY8138481.1 hypothetical protein [Aquimarina sp. 2201CG5-10]
MVTKKDMSNNVSLEKKQDTMYKKILAFAFVIIGWSSISGQDGDLTILPTVQCSSFRPIPGNKYVVSGWLKEDRPQQVLSYTVSGFKIAFTSTDNPEYIFHASGDIIDGWQRFVGVFEVPQDAVNMEIGFIAAELGVKTYFDDIRIHPFNGNMKSFVYDQDTQRLMAELDENNYATLYEYDQEGGLVRVKKETEEGVYTIQETRSGNSKLNN